MVGNLFLFIFIFCVYVFVCCFFVVFCLFDFCVCKFRANGLCVLMTLMSVKVKVPFISILVVVRYLVSFILWNNCAEIYSQILTYMTLSARSYGSQL